MSAQGQPPEALSIPHRFDRSSINQQPGPECLDIVRSIRPETDVG